MKRLSTVVAVGIVVLLTAAVVFGSEQGRNGTYESKIYGPIEKLPKGLLGTWVVKGREVLVTKETEIWEKHGKAAVGAYVEVEGSVSGKTFTVREVKIKKDAKLQ